VQLVLQASLLPDLKGQVAMLDMGEPVRILHLAQRILRLSGLPSRIGEQIVFTGVRPGEKLDEALTAPDEEAIATSHPKISIVQSSGELLPGVLERVEAWEVAFRVGREWAPVKELDAVFPDLDVKMGQEGPGPVTRRAEYGHRSALPPSGD
jgi:FlaA1/EpsC-like NDP-sugar epimerase